MINATQYLGTPWQAGADGPDAYDCMSFARMVQAENFGISMDRIVVPDYDDGQNILRLITQSGERTHWEAVASPREGDIVIVRRPIHIGVWLDNDGGGTLHCLRGAGVVWTPDSAWHVSGLGRKTYLRHRSRL